MHFSSDYFHPKVENRSVLTSTRETISSNCNVHFTNVSEPPQNMMNLVGLVYSSKVHREYVSGHFASVKRYEESMYFYVKAALYRYQTFPSQ